MRTLARLDRIRRISDDAARCAIATGSFLLTLTLGGEPWMGRVFGPIAVAIALAVLLRDLARWQNPKGEEGVIVGIGVVLNLALFGLLELQAFSAWAGIKVLAGILGVLVVGISPFVGLGLGVRVGERRLAPGPEDSIAETRLLARVTVLFALASLTVGTEMAVWLGVAGCSLAAVVLAIAMIYLHRAYGPVALRRAREGVTVSPYATREAETILAAALLVAAIALRCYLHATMFAAVAALVGLGLVTIDLLQLLTFLHARAQERQAAEPSAVPEPPPPPPPPPPVPVAEPATSPEPPPVAEQPSAVPDPEPATTTEPAPPAPSPEPVAEMPPAPEAEPQPVPEPVDAAPIQPAPEVVHAPPPLRRATLHAFDGTEPEMNDACAVLADVMWLAIDSQAAELQFHREGDTIDVRYLRDGVLQEGEILSTAQYEPIRASILELAGEERRFGAEGSRGFVAVHVALDRGSTILKIVRPLPDLPTLEGLGMTAALAEQWRGLVRASGFFLICAPPESGKTTTLYATLMELDREKKKVISLERHVERALPGVEHVEVAVSDSLSDAIKRLSDRTCDVLALPDLDEPDAVREAVNFAIRRGKTVIGATWASTFALSGLAKLVELGVDKLKIGEVVKGVLAQRLARRVCVACRQEGEPDRNVLLDLELKSPPAPYYVSGSCEQCGEAGYQGRVGLFELIALRPFAAGRLLEAVDFRMIESILRDAHFKPMREDGVARAIAGETTCEEVARALKER